MKAFDFEKLKRNYFIGNAIKGMFLAFLIAMAVTGGVGMFSIMLVEYNNLIDSIWNWAPPLAMIIAFAATIIFFMIMMYKTLPQRFSRDMRQYITIREMRNYN